jgi:hypothetical protein
MAPPARRDPDTIARARPYGPNFWRVYRAYGTPKQRLIGYIKHVPVPTTYSFTATNASPCVFTSTAAYAAGAVVILLTGAPTGFSTGTKYVVTAATATTFELTSINGGSALASGSTGTGTVHALVHGAGLFAALDLKKMQVGTFVYTLKAATQRLDQHKSRNERQAHGR